MTAQYSFWINLWELVAKQIRVKLCCRVEREGIFLEIHILNSPRCRGDSVWLHPCTRSAAHSCLACACDAWCSDTELWLGGWRQCWPPIGWRSPVSLSGLAGADCRDWDRDKSLQPRRWSHSWVSGLSGITWSSSLAISDTARHRSGDQGTRHQTRAEPGWKDWLGLQDSDCFIHFDMIDSSNQFSWTEVYEA